MYIKVDSVVGDRCYFAHPHCNITAPSGGFPAPGNKISSALWGSDTPVPASIQAKFPLGGTTGGVLVSAAATDIRPEDGLFASCRANSKLGGPANAPTGLGYNSVNASGACPSSGTLAALVGSDILSGLTSTGAAHVLDFNISGTDPFSAQAIPAATTVSAGADPMVFVIQRTSELAGATNATTQQLQSIFGGDNCDGSVVGGAGGAISVYLREPLSGTMNTTEATVFKLPDSSGISQEKNVNAMNPLTNKGCVAGGGARYRGIGTGEVVAGVLNSQANTGHDGIAYTFFSYGNVSSLGGTTALDNTYGYLTLDGVDPIFHVPNGGGNIDPGQPSIAGALPNAADLPATCVGGNFPCREDKIWSGHWSFPNLRSGQYKAWSILRMVSDGTALAVVKTLVTKSQVYVVSDTPDYVPVLKTVSSPSGLTDPGLYLLRSHYTQSGVNPVNQASTGDKGGDMGGCILFNGLVVTGASSDTTTKLAMTEGGGCAMVP
jgi:hypothetical protein